MPLSPGDYQKYVLFASTDRLTYRTLFPSRTSRKNIGIMFFIYSSAQLFQVVFWTSSISPSTEKYFSNSQQKITRVFQNRGKNAKKTRESTRTERWCNIMNFFNQSDCQNCPPFCFHAFPAQKFYENSGGLLNSFWLPAANKIEDPLKYLF